MKILKNTTLTDIDLLYLGMTIPASGQREIETTDYDSLSSSDSITEITTQINSGDIVVNNGNRDLNATEALIYITLNEEADKLLFDNTSNSFTATNVQDAIEEASTGGNSTFPFTGMDCGCVDTNRILDYYDSSGNTIVTNGSPVLFDTIRSGSDSIFFNVSSGEVSINGDGTYWIQADISTQLSSGSSRTSSYARLQKNTGSGWVNVPGTICYMYNRTNNSDENTGSFQALLELNQGDQLRCWAERDSGSSIVVTIPNASRMTIRPILQKMDINLFDIDCGDVSTGTSYGNIDCGVL